jgi:hypothetical protein
MMIAYVAFFSFVLAVMCARALVASATGSARAHTFLVDPPTLLVVGFLASLVGMSNRKGRPLTVGEFHSRKRIVDRLLVLFVLGFWTMEALTYFNVMGHPFDPAKTGNDFMWNGYIEWFTGPMFDTTVPTYKDTGMNLLAIGLWLLQIPALLLGRAIGYRTSRFGGPHGPYRSVTGGPATRPS